ncbi:hypothetical protein DSLASN_45740 [Desulfoluna limicola]|uniref:CHAT domain-containing protein n=1 Tax=Desulfoluna limicola TaxID=2810562 RepID=A0ABM7PN44_9BACT|nr:CHAT domain-containing protein [Desulfoluna limicola]BCS98942.1 hypothetical protein DSLASN_45740 [Desulfoluna limicola]
MKYKNRLTLLLVSLVAICLLQGCAISKITSIQIDAERKLYSEAVEGFEREIGAYENWVPEDKFLDGPKFNWGLIEVCNCYYELGNMSKAEECAMAYEKLFLTEVLRDSKDNYYPIYFQHRYYGLLTKLHLELGNYEKARVYAEKMIEINIREFGSLTETKGGVEIYADFMADAAIAFARTGDPDKARELLAVIHNIGGGRDSIGTSWVLKRMYSAQARGYVAIGDYEKAKEALGRKLGSQAYFGRAIVFLHTMGISELAGIGKEQSNPFSLNETIMLSRIYLDTEEYEKAKPLYDALINNTHRLLGTNYIRTQTDLSNRPGIYYALLHDRGKIALHEGDRELAVSCFKQALDIIEGQRATIHTESSKIGFVGDKQAVYRDLTALLIEMGRYEEAFAIAERSKARALVDMLASKSDLSGGERANTEELTGLLREVDDLEHKAKILVAENEAGQPSARRSVELKQRQILQADPEFSSLVAVTPPDVKAIQALLPENETLIEYYGDETGLFAFVVTRNEIRAVALGPVDIKEKVAGFRTWIQTPPAEVRGLRLAKSKGPVSQANKTGEELYNDLIAPLAKHIETRNLTIVPHGALHYLPFNALSNGNTYLIDRYRVRVLPSASVMAFLKNDKQNYKGKLLAFGNPDLGNPALDLPGAEAESRAITRKVSKASLYTRKEATETVAKADGSRYKYVHFALHGTFDSDKPLSSGLLLAPDTQNDGILTVGELYTMNIPADLVTLSACETALGKIANGDDVVGFTRGFLYAGTQSIVSTLWKVDDQATSKLIQKFYRELEKTDKRQALRNAQRYVKNNINDHPYYWAAFQLTGNI